MTTSCSAALLESALVGSLPPEQEEALHRHLEECETCSAALEQMAGGDAWCRETATLLAGDELDETAPAPDQWSNADFTVEHLEASDQPNVLGRLGGYDVLEIIGRGGMGVVLKGFDPELKRCVAIKVLAPHLAQSSLAKKRFIREAQAAAAVVHPNVLAIHQVQPAGRLPFLVMPLVAGESLAARLVVQGRLELMEVLRIGMQAAAGLAAAHEQGLVRRDVKPANILLERGVERAVLMDFGLARAADDVSMTRWGIIAGTPQYMSPEQARGEPLDGRSDLFSLGCVLYEMATGVSPFRADSTMATLRRLIDDPPQAMASLNPELPPWFIAIVDRLLEKDPSRRFASAKEVSELLEGCLAHLQQPASVPLPAGIPIPAIRPVSKPRKTFWKGAIAVITSLGIALLGMFLVQATEPPDIAGKWSGEGWGQVVLRETAPGEYAGTYSDTVGKQPGKIELKWSRIECRFNGQWSEGEDRFGELSLRLVDQEIRGALTTDPKSKINPATPQLADLVWKQVEATPRDIADWPKVPAVEPNKVDKAKLDAECTSLFQQAGQLKPDDAESRNRIAAAMTKAGIGLPAIELLREALKIKPDFAEAHNNLGYALLQPGIADDAKEAIGHFEKALSLKPDYPEAHNNLGLALICADGEGRAKEAIPHYQRALELKPDDPEIHYNLGVAYSFTCEPEREIEELRKALRLKPDYCDAHFSLAVTLAKVGRLNEAIVSYRQAIQLRPDFFDAYDNLAEAYSRKNDMAQAIAAAQKALAIARSGPPYRDLTTVLEKRIEYYRAAQRATGGTTQETQTRGPAVGQSGGGLSRRVAFEVGETYLRDGDRIAIDEIHGTADTIKEGNVYEVKGTYRLASRDKAMLAVYTTVGSADPTAWRFRDVPDQKTQSMTVERGEGRFTLVFYMWQKGCPHVSFYSDKESFASVYFGTGDCVFRVLPSTGGAAVLDKKTAKPTAQERDPQVAADALSKFIQLSEPEQKAAILDGIQRIQRKCANIALSTTSHVEKVDVNPVTKEATTVWEDFGRCVFDLHRIDGSYRIAIVRYRPGKAEATERSVCQYNAETGRDRWLFTERLRDGRDQQQARISRSIRLDPPSNVSMPHTWEVWISRDSRKTISSSSCWTTRPIFRFAGSTKRAGWSRPVLPTPPRKAERPALAPCGWTSARTLC